MIALILQAVGGFTSLLSMKKMFLNTSARNANSIQILYDIIIHHFMQICNTFYHWEYKWVCKTAIVIFLSLWLFSLFGIRSIVVFNISKRIWRISCKILKTADFPIMILQTILFSDLIDIASLHFTAEHSLCESFWKAKINVDHSVNLRYNR